MNFMNSFLYIKFISSPFSVLIFFLSLLFLPHPDGWALQYNMERNLWYKTSFFCSWSQNKDFNFLTTNYVCYRFFLVEELIILRNISSISSLLGNLSFLSWKTLSNAVSAFVTFFICSVTVLDYIDFPQSNQPCTVELNLIYSW